MLGRSVCIATIRGLSLKGGKIQEGVADRERFFFKAIIRRWICGQNILVNLYGTTKLSKKCLLNCDLDGGLYPDLQLCGLPLAS